MITYNQLNIAEFNTKSVPLCSVKTSRKLKKQNKTRFYIKALIGFLITALLISIIIIIKLHRSLHSGKKDPEAIELPEQQIKPTILTPLEEYDLKADFIYNRFCDFKLIYKATIHGDKIENLLQATENVSPLLIIILTETNEKFGIHLTQTIEEGKNMLNIDADLFNLDIYTSYYIKNKFYEINRNNGIMLRISDQLIIWEECITKRKEIDVLFCLNKSKEDIKKYYIKEIEIFNIVNKMFIN